MKVNEQSLISFSAQVFKLLPFNKRSTIVQHLILSVILAGLEVISLAIIFPMLHLLVNGSEHGSTLSKGLNLLTIHIHWSIILAGVVSVYMTKNIFAIWHSHRQSRLLDELYVFYSEQIYQQFYRQSWTQYIRETSSESFRKIKNTAYEFTHNVLHNYMALLPEVLICVLMVIVVIWIDYSILFFLMLLILPLLVSYYLFRKKIITKIDRSFRELTPKVSVVLTQGIDSFGESKIYQKENYFIRHFTDISKITTQQLSRLKTFMNLPSRIVEAVGVLCFVSIIAYGKLHPDNEQSILVFLAMLSLVIYRILPSLNKIFTSLSQIQAYAYVVSEMKEILGSAGEETPISIEKIKFEEKIELKSVSFRYEHKSRAYLLKNLSLKIDKGDFIVLEGPSGSGKTTLIHLLCGLIDDYSGQILIDDVVLTRSNLADWQTHLGFVPQAPIVLQDSILHNIAFGVDDDQISMNRVDEAVMLSGLTDLVDTLPLKLNTPVGENGLTFSGGQRQRLILARALYRNAKVLLLDEVTNQLDEQSKLTVLRNLQQLAEDGRTILLATHDPTVRNFANRVLRIEDMHFAEVSLRPPFSV